MLFKQCLNAVLIGIGHLVLGIKMYRKKHTVVFLKTSNVFQKTSNVFQKHQMFFSKQRYVFSTLILLNVFQSYRQKKGLNIFKLSYYAIHRTEKSHTFASSI